MPATTDDRTKVCTICGKDKAAHVNCIHRFSPYGENSVLTQRTDADKPPAPPAQAQVRIPSGGDPLLRMVLLRKGLITVADLDELEAELRATGVAGYAPSTTLG